MPTTPLPTIKLRYLTVGYDRHCGTNWVPFEAFCPGIESKSQQPLARWDLKATRIARLQRCLGGSFSGRSLHE